MILQQQQFAGSQSQLGESPLALLGGDRRRRARDAPQGFNPIGKVGFRARKYTSENELHTGNLFGLNLDLFRFNLILQVHWQSGNQNRSPHEPDSPTAHTTHDNLVCAFLLEQVRSQLREDAYVVRFEISTPSRKYQDEVCDFRYHR